MAGKIPPIRGRKRSDSGKPPLEVRGNKTSQKTQTVAERYFPALGFKLPGQRLPGTRLDLSLVCKNVKYLNLKRIAGYVPVISMFLGLDKVFKMYKKPGFFKSSLLDTQRKFLVARSIFEILNIGFLFVIPDILISLKMHSNK